MSKKKDLKALVDKQLTDMMEADSEPSEGRMKLLTIAIKKLALDAKLEENEYGGFFGTDDPAAELGHSDRPAKRQDRPKPASGLGEAGGTEH